MAAPTNEEQKSKINQRYAEGRGGYNAQWLDSQELGQPSVSAGLDQLESYANDPKNASSNIDTAREQEQTPKSPWRTNVSTYGGKPTEQGRTLTPANARAIIKKRGTIGLLATIILGGGAAGVFFTSPALLLVQIKETMMEKFNTQLTTTTYRSSHIMATKISGTTSGLCGEKITIRCKYNSMSAKEATDFQANAKDIKLTTNSSVIPGRVTVTGIEYKGEVIQPREFQSRIMNDMDFRSSVQKGFGYNPKFAGFYSPGWFKVASSLGLSKRSPIEDAKTDEERAKKLNEAVKNGSSGTVKVPAVGEEKPGGGEYTQADIDSIEAENARITAELEEAGRRGTQLSSSALDQVDNAASGAVGTAVNAVKITGVADIGCQAYQSVQALGMAAKTVRAVQLARYAMVFMVVADKIKAGTATPEEVAYLGTILTKEKHDAKGVGKSATDSFGYKFAAYGDTGGYTQSAGLSRFMAGGGLTGSLIDATNQINQLTGGTPRTVCATLANPWVQAGSLIGGAILFVTGVGTAAQVAKGATSISAQFALSLALAALPDLMKDIVAGNVTNGIYGEDTGNALTSGSSTMLNQVAGANGNAAMKKRDALAYDRAQQVTIAQLGEQERQTLSPLDTSSKYTFMGSLAFQFTPVLTAGSLSSASSSFASLIHKSFLTFTPGAQALTDAERARALELCQDPDLKELDVATDPFCNVIQGIPPQYLNRDPNAVLDSLAGQVNEETGEPVSGSAYATFYDRCLDRDYSKEPLGSGLEGDKDRECIINDSNANYYLFYVDNHVVLEGIENGYMLSADTAATGTATTPTSSSTGSVIKGDDYPYKNARINTASPLTYFHRECVDFVAWRLNVQSGITQAPFKFGGYGNAFEWKQNAIKNGFKVDKKPTVGSVAWWAPYVSAVTIAGEYGHVAIVSEVKSDGSIVIEQYNGMGAPNDHKYDSITIPASKAQNLEFLHIADIGAAV